MNSKKLFETVLIQACDSLKKQGMSMSFHPVEENRHGCKDDAGYKEGIKYEMSLIASSPYTTIINNMVSPNPFTQGAIEDGWYETMRAALTCYFFPSKESLLNQLRTLSEFESRTEKKSADAAEVIYNKEGDDNFGIPDELSHLKL